MLKNASAMVAIGAIFLLVGCASGAGRYAGELPGSRLSGMTRFYVQHHGADPRDIHLAIQEELRTQGFHVDAGKSAPSGDYDAIVTYRDRYVWDFTMYCQQLTVYFRDVRTGYVTATGWSFRPSAVRKTPQGHARLIFTELFGGAAE